MNVFKKTPVLVTGLALAMLSFLAGWELQQSHTPIVLEPSLSLAVSGTLMMMTSFFCTIVSLGLVSRIE